MHFRAQAHVLLQPIYNFKCSCRLNSKIFSFKLAKVYGGSICIHSLRHHEKGPFHTFSYVYTEHRINLYVIYEIL